MVGSRLNKLYFRDLFTIVSEPIERMEVVCLAHKNSARLMAKVNEEIKKLKVSAGIKQIMTSYE